jgi:hypothetical protein
MEMEQRVHVNLGVQNCQCNPNKGSHYMNQANFRRPKDGPMSMEKEFFSSILGYQKFVNES